ncbi:hypothetical protein O181_059730 [Austropuccinia psidii MF-1]|uniref:Uncharacterized protein n=1 Tax=Austropuccinia psidii MF-1 TaxID=1389203 RepID=A0A9Q3HYZ5_9BASI|nr:hypothetical protein [Austropuccinia psidii MF-1]
MSSSKPCESHSGSVHDSDSESGIEFSQTQSPMSQNIPFTTPIASSMNVSGLNIDVGNPTPPTSSTWSIPNILSLQFPQIPLIHKFMCLRGKEAHLKSHQRLIHNQIFPHDFLLNPGWNPVAYQEPFGRSKQPTLNIPSGSQVHVGN